MRERIMVVVLACMLFMSDLHIVYADNKPDEVIKVAYYDMSSYYTLDEYGNMDSYEKAYLDEVSKYSGLKFQYIDCKTFSQALVMLKNHEVDLIGHLQNDEKREDEFLYGKRKYGVTYNVLEAPQDSDIIYADYDKIGKCSIGVVNTYVNNNELDQQLRDKNINCKIVEYDTISQLYDAVDNHEVDLAFCSEQMAETKWKTVDRFSYGAIYFATWRGNSSLIDKIDNAILQIDLYENDFMNKKLAEYFPEINEIPYTKEELEYINQNNENNIYFDGKAVPMSYLDKQTGEMKGILVDVLKLVSKESGLKFNFKAKNGKYQEDEQALYSYMDFDINELKDNHMIYSDKFFDGVFVLYHKHSQGKNITDGENHTVAIPKNREYIRSYLKEKYSNYSIVEYSSAEKCMEALINNKVDFVFLNEYVADYILVKGSIDGIDIVPETDYTADFILRCHDSINPLVISIINKSISHLSEKDVSRVATEYAVSTRPDITLNYLIMNHFDWIVTITIIIMLLVAIIIYSIVKYRALIKEKRIVEDAGKILENEKQKAVLANMAKGRFLSRMSHEIRTPIHAIMGLAGMVKDDIKDEENNKDEQIEKIDELQKAARYLLSVISDILDTSKIESDKIILAKEVVDGTQFLKSVCDMVTPQAEKRGITFNFERKSFVSDAYMGDVNRLKQILMNVLNNAVKFTPAGGSVNMSVYAEEIGEESTKVTFEVTDTGIGMTSEFVQNELFEPFSQENSDLTSPYDGAGLGLSISRRLARLMGGDIICHSKLGEGSDFIITVVVNKAKEKDIARYVEDKTTKKIDLTGKTILICEDNNINQMILKEMLERQGCTTDVASNGQIAVDMFWNSKDDYYSAILMDIRMPVLDGLNATKRIRSLKREDAKKVPIIAVSANAFKDDIEKSFEAGMNEHLSKPVNSNLLYQTLEKYI